jgi:hypothetical protein
MRIEIERTEENVALLKALASRKPAEREAAHLSLAEFIGPVIQQVINQAPTLSNLFRTLEFDEDSNPSIPLDLYTDVTDEDYIRVWSQAEPGGLPYNQPTPPTQELKFMTYTLDSAIAFNQKYAQQSRLDVVAKSMERMFQEILLKQERNSAGIILRALALASTDINGSATRHVIRSQNPNQFILDDFNRLFTLTKRIKPAWSGGTPIGGAKRGLTDLIVSPEVVEYLRGLAYNPINTKAGVLSGTDSAGYASSVVTLPDSMREQVYNTAGVPEFYGVNIMEINELGVGYKYNDLFDAFAGSISYPNHPGTSAGTTFDGTAEEIVIGLDLSVDSMLRPVIRDGETGSQFVVESDDQFVKRQKKIGFYGSLEESRILTDDRVLTGCIV